MRSPPPSPLEPLLRAAGQTFAELLDRAGELRLQILISQILESGSGPHISTYCFRPDAEYFYPASTVKLCAAVAALQRVNDLQRAGRAVDLHSPIEIAPLFDGDPPQRSDSSNLDGQALTLGHEIRKLCIVSDNHAFSRLFDFVGFDDLNTRMHDAGLGSVVISHRLSDLRPIQDQRRSAEVRARSDGAVISPARTGTLTLCGCGKPGTTVGRGFLRAGAVSTDGIDFTRRNAISLQDLHDLLILLVRPDVPIHAKRIELSGDHRRFLLQAMREYPRESRNPVYEPGPFPDQLTKFLLPGVRRVFPEISPGLRVEVMSKVGQAYGFTVENSYLFNPITRREAAVTAVIYTNANGILNDDNYEYKSLAEPFMANLGEFVARRFLAGPARDVPAP